MSVPNPSTVTTRARRAATASGVVAVGAALLLAGCSGSASAQTGAPSAATVQEGGTVRFGTPFTYGDGLFVEARVPATFTPTAQAEGVEGLEGTPVRIRLKITNGTRAPFTPHTLDAGAVSGGQAAVQIEDPGSQIALTGPGLELRSAGTSTFDLGFVVADPSDITLTIVPAIGGYEPLVVTS